jgi:hypothetical protein
MFCMDVSIKTIVLHARLWVIDRSALADWSATNTSDPQTLTIATHGHLAGLTLFSITRIACNLAM